jgi:putative ABC transport system permease protein
MRFSIVCGSALRALRRNLLRTILSTVAMAVGVGAVMTIVALGSGARGAIEQDVMSAGTNLIVVSAGNWTTGGVRLGMRSSSRLTPDDADSIRVLPDVAYVAPGLRVRRQLVVDGQNWAATVEGTGVDLPLIRSWPVVQGRFFGPHEVRAAAPCGRDRRAR